MVALTSKHVLITLAAGVVGYLVLLLPALLELPVSPVPFGVQEALSVIVKSWWTPISSTVVTSFTAINDDSPKEEEEESEAAAEAAVPEIRKRTLLEQRFAMDGPELGWDVATITLDYQLAEWVSNDVLDYDLYDWTCQNILDVKEPPGWTVLVPEMIGPVQVVEVAKEEGDIEQSNSDENSAEEPEMKMNHWKLALQPMEDGEHDDANVSTSFCIRFKLYNIPKHRQHAMEVTFRQTQLEIAIQEGLIQHVVMSTPEPVTVHVKVNGRGRAVVHGNPNDIHVDEANQQNDDNDDDNDDEGNNGGKKNDNNEEEEEQEKGGIKGELPPLAPTSTDTVNDEL